MLNSITYTESSAELIKYFIKLSDLLKYAEINDMPHITLGVKQVSVLDLKKSMFNLLHNLKHEMFTYHKESNSTFSENEVYFIEKLAQYDQYTALNSEYMMNKCTKGILQFLGGLVTLMRFNKDATDVLVSDAALFGVGSLLNISSTPFDKLRADIDMLHIAEEYADYLKSTRFLSEHQDVESDFEAELGSEYSIQSLDVVPE